MAEDLDTSQIRDWRSIVTLVVFIVTNIFINFPLHIPIYFPRIMSNVVLDILSAWRVISPRQDRFQHDSKDDPRNGKFRPSIFVRLNFPINFVTAPLIADIFLLAILAIGRQEVHDGTIGANNISPVEIVISIIALAYIAISIDASGLTRYLAFKVLQKGGKIGHRLFFYLYASFFGLGIFIGNYPIILSSTAFLAYMTRISSNIMHPRAWIHTQFAIANIASAIFVSSNPTNLILAGAFQIKFIEYTTNMIVPVIITAIVLFPFLLYVLFAIENFIPFSIEIHKLPIEAENLCVNPNIPYSSGLMKEQEDQFANDEQGKLFLLNEILNPFLDIRGAIVGTIIITITLSVLLGLSAASQSTNEYSIIWITLPAAFVMFCWDIAFGWYCRDEVRQIARKGRQEIEYRQARKAIKKEEAKQVALDSTDPLHLGYLSPPAPALLISNSNNPTPFSKCLVSKFVSRDNHLQENQLSTGAMGILDENQEFACLKEIDEEKQKFFEQISARAAGRPSTLGSLVGDTYRWLQDTFPTATMVTSHLPFALVPFALSMFVLVQALVTKGWVLVFAYGWDHWVNKTGTVGAVGGMGFLSVILCNIAGTNIGTTILLSRLIQTWQQIHRDNGIPITNRTFWATVYSMALGVNYGAFSTAFSASLAGLIWRDILARKHIHVRRLEFASVNLPIISIAMAVGCAVLISEVYITRDNSPYDS